MSSDEKSSTSVLQILGIGTIIAAIITVIGNVMVAYINKDKLEDQLIILTLTAAHRPSAILPTNAVPGSLIQATQPFVSSTAMVMTPLPFDLPSSTAGKLTMSVTQVEVLTQGSQGKQIRIHLLVDNNYNEAVTIYAFSNIQVIDEDGERYGPPFMGSWNGDFPAHMQVKALLDIENPIPNTVKTLTLNVPTIYGSGFETLELGQKHLTIPNIVVP